jgi:hypothetical protein
VHQTSMKHFIKEFYTVSNPKSRHISYIRLEGDHNNNKLGRMNDEVRDREKVMRGLKIPSTGVLPVSQIYHNYIRPHEALDNITPAEACDIRKEGQNKWKTIIENALQQHVR